MAASAVEGVEQLRRLMFDWLKTGPRQFELAAAFKDFAALLEIAPKPCGSGWSDKAHTRRLSRVISALLSFLRQDAMPMLHETCNWFRHMLEVSQ